MAHPLIKKLSWFFLFVLLGGVFFFPYNALAKRLFKLSLPLIEAAGVNIEPRDISRRFPGTFVLSDVRVTPRSVPIPVIVESLELDPGYFQTLLLQPSIHSVWNVLNGSVESDISSSYRSQLLSGDVRIKNLALDAHPLGKFFGIVGTLNGEAHASNYPYEIVDFPDEYSTTLHLSQGSFIGGYKLAGAITLPAVSELDINMSIFCEKSVCSIREAKLLSSLLNGSGEGKFSLGEDIFRRIDLNFSFTLSESGKKALGGYLALAAQKDPHQVGSAWNVQILKEPNGAIRSIFTPEPS